MKGNYNQKMKNIQHWKLQFWRLSLRMKSYLKKQKFRMGPILRIWLRILNVFILILDKFKQANLVFESTKKTGDDLRQIYEERLE